MKRTILVIAVIAFVAVAVFGSQVLADKPETRPSNTAMTETLNSIDQTVTDTQGNVTYIKGELDDPNYGLAEIKAEVASIEGTVNTINGTVATIDGRLDTIEDKLDTVIDLIQPSLMQQLIQDFAVASGESVTAGDVVSFLDGYVQKGFVQGDEITYGSEHVFNSGFTLVISAAALSPSKFVVAYRDVGNSGDGTAIIGDVSGNAITYGSEYVFNSAHTYDISAAALSSDKFVVAYRDDGNSLYGTAVIGDVSGNAITYGSEYVFHSGSTDAISAAALSSSKFVVAYWDAGSSSYDMAVIGDVSGNAITYGSEYVFNSGTTYALSAAALSSDKFVVAYSDWGNSEYGTAIIGDVSGNAITYGSEHVFNSGFTDAISAAALSSDKFVVVYKDAGSSSYGTAIIGDVSGNAITYGSEEVFNSANTGHISAAALSSSKFVVAYRDVGNSGDGTAIIGDVSGNAITYGSEEVFHSGSTGHISAAALSSSKFVVAYWDAGNSGYGTAVIGERLSPNMIGIANEAKTAGETVPVIIGGVSDVHSGLTPGAVYYSDAAGDLTKVFNVYRVGLAISATDILLGLNKDTWH